MFSETWPVFFTRLYLICFENLYKKAVYLYLLCYVGGLQLSVFWYILV